VTVLIRLSDTVPGNSVVLFKVCFLLLFSG